jgi:toxin ParE1/3/4
MTQLRVSADARGDLADIWWFIAQNNEPAADKIITTITKKFDELVVSPGMGRKRNELSPGLRSFPIGKYLILYQPIEDGIEIVRVVHGARDIEELFE